MTNDLSSEQRMMYENRISQLTKRINDIKEGFEGCCNACEPVGVMNKKLREERDEARREVCVWQALERGGKPCDIAPKRGWDYLYKDDDK